MRSSMWLQMGAFSSEFCKKVVDECSILPAISGRTDGSGEELVRDSTIRWVNPESMIRSILMQSVKKANRDCYAVEVDDVYEIQYTEYEAENRQFYDWHQDVVWNTTSPYDRKLTISVQLSNPEDYDGGNFELEHCDVPEDFKKQGSLLIIPSYVRHRVTPVTRGRRISLVAWAEGPRWK